MNTTTLFTLIAAAVCFCATARARTDLPGSDVSPADGAVLKTVVRSCDADDTVFLDDRIDDEISIFLISRSTVSDGDVIYIYAPKTWDIVMAAARRFRQLGFVVTDEQFWNEDLRSKVMTASEFRALGGANADCSTGREIGRCGSTEAKIARILFAVSLKECGGEFALQQYRRNVLRPMYSRMVKFLWDRHEDYDPVAKAWRPALMNKPTR